jgi:hypothetical protein
MEGFIPIEKFEIQYTPPPPHPPRRRRKDLYISDSSDEKVKKEISVEGIDGDETDGEEADESVNMKENVEKIIEKVDRKFVRTYNDKKMKKARISLSYHRKMEDRRIEDLKYRTKPKIARRRRG